MKQLTFLFSFHTCICIYFINLYCFSWTEDLEDLKEQRNRLLGDCLLGAAFLSYLGAFSWDFRNDLLRQEWEKDIVAKDIPKSEPFKVNNMFYFKNSIARNFLYKWYINLKYAE